MAKPSSISSGSSVGNSTKKASTSLSEYLSTSASFGRGLSFTGQLTVLPML
jgi:hypothetical protein